MVNGRHLYSAFIQSTVQFMPLIHPFTHTLMVISCHERYQPAHQEQLGVRCLAQGHFILPREGLNRQPSDCQTTALTSWAISPRPLKKRKDSYEKLAPWWNTRALKQASRQFEHKWHSTKLQVFFHAWKDSLLSYKHALSTARSSYFWTLLDKNRNNPRHLFNTISRLTKNHVNPCVSILFSSNDFMNFFDDKFIKIRDTIQSSSAIPHAGSTLPSTQMDAEFSEGRLAHLNSFASIDVIEFNTIVNSSKSSTCFLSQQSYWRSY